MVAIIFCLFNLRAHSLYLFCCALNNRAGSSPRCVPRLLCVQVSGRFTQWETLERDQGQEGGRSQAVFPSLLPQIVSPARTFFPGPSFCWTPILPKTQLTLGRSMLWGQFLGNSPDLWALVMMPLCKS